MMSGLSEAVTVLEGVSGVAVASFAPEDIIRHDVVTRIVTAYDRYDRQKKAGRGGTPSGSDTV